MTILQSLQRSLRLSKVVSPPLDQGIYYEILFYNNYHHVAIIFNLREGSLGVLCFDAPCIFGVSSGKVFVEELIYSTNFWSAKFHLPYFLRYEPDEIVEHG